MSEQTVTIELPRNLLTAARSRTRPSESSEAGQQIAQSPAYNLLNTPTRNYRDTASVITLIRHLARAEGPFASAVHTMVEVAATKYRVFAYSDVDHQFNTEATKTALSILAAMDTPTDYSGVTQKKSIDETVRGMLREGLLTGMVACELVLDESRLPSKIQTVGAETLIWEDDGDGGAIPAQQISGQNDPVSLDIPTFFFSHLAPDPATVSPRSMMEACIKMLVYFGEFLDEIRRSVRVAGHNRLTVSLDAEKISKTAPKDVQSDPGKLQAYMSAIKTAVETSLAGLDPEDSLVFFQFGELGSSSVGSRFQDRLYPPIERSGRTVRYCDENSAFGARFEIGGRFPADGLG